MSNFGFGLLQMVAVIPAVIVVAVLSSISPVAAIIAGVPVLAIGLGTVMAMEGIFKAALYEYVSEGKIPEFYDRETLEGAYAVGSTGAYRGGAAACRPLRPLEDNPAGRPLGGPLGCGRAWSRVRSRGDLRGVMAGKTAKGKPGATGTQGQMSDAAVQRRTRKTWPEWFVALDSTGARTMSHREIVAVLRQEFGIPDWWQQMVAVGYEQARGLQKKHEGPDGYQIGVSRTVPWGRPAGGSRRRAVPESLRGRRCCRGRSRAPARRSAGASRP